MSDLPADDTDQRAVVLRLADLDLPRLGRISMIAVLGALLVGGYVIGARVAQGSIDTSGTGLLLGLLLMIGSLALVLVLHEAVHGLVIALCGVRPVFGAGRMQGIPYLYAGAPGHHFTRRQFLLVGWAPTIVVNGVLLALLVTWPWAVWLVPALALHISGCVGDWAMMAALHRQHPGTMVEDTHEGIIMLPPEAT